MRKVKLIKGEGYPIFSFEEVPFYFKTTKALPKHLRDVVVEVSDEKLEVWKKVVKQYLELQDHLEKVWSSQTKE